MSKLALKPAHELISLMLKIKRQMLADIESSLAGCEAKWVKPISVKYINIVPMPADF